MSRKLGNIMQITELERAVLKKMISDLRSPSNKPSIDLGMVRVKDRHYTGEGFLTEFILTEDLKLCSEDVTMRWGNIGAKVTSSNIETGYLGYIDNGYLASLEGIHTESLGLSTLSTSHYTTCHCPLCGAAPRYKSPAAHLGPGKNSAPAVYCVLYRTTG